VAKNPAPRTYEKMVFDPNPDHPHDPNSGTCNLFRGFGTQPIAGDVTPFLDYIHDIYANGDDEGAEYILNWDAHLFQFAHIVPEVALVARGIEGIGESKHFEILRLLFNSKDRSRNLWIEVSKGEEVFGRFTGHLNNKLMIVLDEAMWAGNHQFGSVFKHLVSAKERYTESKHKDGKTIDSYFMVGITTNEDWAVPTSKEARRISIFVPSEAHRNDHEHFANFDNWLLNEHGLERIMYYMLHRDLSGFNVRKNFYTPELANQKIRSLVDEDRFWFERIHSGKLSFVDDIFIDPDNGQSQKILEGIKGQYGSETLLKGPDDGKRHIIMEKQYEQYCKMHRMAFVRNRATMTHSV
jgi:Family of unknown function (DUF5906)